MVMHVHHPEHAVALRNCFGMWVWSSQLHEPRHFAWHESESQARAHNKVRQHERKR